MAAQYALLSLIYMIGFVILFDRFRYKRKLVHWLRSSKLMDQREVEQIQAILTACQEN